jgi:hypothetical protein
MPDAIAADRLVLGLSLARLVGRNAYDLNQLRAALDRLAFLLDGSGGESLFHPGQPYG